MIRIVVHNFELTPKQADRSGIRNGRIHHYRDPKVTANAKALALMIQRFAPRTAWTGPVGVALAVSFCRPKKAPGNVWKDTKPDVDNLAKQVLDVLQHCGFFNNDAQVARLVVTKLYESIPRVRISLMEMKHGSHSTVELESGRAGTD